MALRHSIVNILSHVYLHICVRPRPCIPRAIAIDRELGWELTKQPLTQELASDAKVVPTGKLTNKHMTNEGIKLDTLSQAAINEKQSLIISPCFWGWHWHHVLVRCPLLHNDLFWLQRSKLSLQCHPVWDKTTHTECKVYKRTPLKSETKLEVTVSLKMKVLEAVWSS